MNVTIGRLQARWSGDEAPDRGGLRSRLATLLDSADLQPRGLPPSAILIVRRMADPLPGSLSAQKDPFQPPRAWERAARSSLEDLLRCAARPEHGRVAADDRPAVLFSGLGELLACLAMDLSEHQTASRWWWQALLRQSPQLAGLSPTGKESTSLYRVLAAHIERLPAVVDHLAAWGRLAPVFSRLEDGQSAALLRALAHAYHLPAPDDFLPDYSSISPTHPDGTSASPAPPTPDDSPVPAGHQETPARSSQPTMEPWANLLRQTAAAGLALPAGLKPEATALLVTALGLVRAPALARRAGFAQAVGLAVQAAHRLGSTPGAQARSIPPAPTPEAAQPAPAPPDAASQPAAPLKIADPAVTGQPAPYVLAGGARVTGLGGVLYLANLIIRLDLPDCFAAHPSLAGSLSAWGALTLLALDLCAEQPDELTQDPLWDLLAGLDGRAPGSFPGADLPLETTFLLPPAWYAHLRSAVPAPPGFCWAETSGQLLLWDDAGVMLARCPRFADQTGAEQARMVLAGYTRDDEVVYLSARTPEAAPPLRPSAALAERLSPGAVDWLGCVLPYLSLLLRGVLRLAAHDSLVAAVLRLRARLYLTSTHLDLVAPLDGISTAVRSAGLDQDPGWQPAFGRVILFHYE